MCAEHLTGGGVEWEQGYASVFVVQGFSALYDAACHARERGLGPCC